MDASLIISTYNRPDALEAVLVSVYNLVVKPAQLIIADDGSSFETKRTINKYREILPMPIIHAWHPDEGFRLAEIRNKGLAYVTSPYVIMIDGDMILNKYFIRDHLFFARKGFFIQGKRFLLTEKKTQKILIHPSITFIARWGDPDIEHRLEKKLFAFRSLLLSRLTKRTFSHRNKGIRGCNISFFYNDLVKINGFNNRFSGWGCEDLELVERLFNIGVERQDIAFSALAYHLYHQSETRDSLPENNRILKDCIQEGSKRCEDGLDRYLNRFLMEEHEKSLLQED